MPILIIRTRADSQSGTEEQWRRLLHSAGLEICEIQRSVAGPGCLIVAKKA